MQINSRGLRDRYPSLTIPFIRHDPALYSSVNRPGFTEDQLGLTWQRGALTGTLESVLYARQSKTSWFNAEEKTAGYGLINLRGHYQFDNYFNLSTGIENLLDKDYADHLSGYNRNADSDIDIGDRLPGRGRNLFIAVHLSW